MILVTSLDYTKGIISKGNEVTICCLIMAYKIV